MIAFCKFCGLVFHSNLIAGIDSTVSLKNVGTSCIRCNRPAVFLDGKFNFDKDGNVTLVSGPKLTHLIVDQIKDLATKASAGGYTKEKFINEAEKIQPGIGEFLKKYVPKDFSDLSNFFLLVIGILTYLHTVQTSKKIDNIKTEIPTRQVVKQTWPQIQRGAGVKKNEPREYKKKRKKK